MCMCVCESVSICHVCRCVSLCHVYMCLCVYVLCVCVCVSISHACVCARGFLGAGIANNYQKLNMVSGNQILWLGRNFSSLLSHLYSSTLLCNIPHVYDFSLGLIMGGIIRNKKKQFKALGKHCQIICHKMCYGMVTSPLSTYMSNPNL